MKRYFRRIDKKLLLFTVLLFVLGLLMVFSSSSVAAFMRYKYSNPASFFIRQAIFMGFGALFFLVAIRFSTKSYGPLSWVGLVILAVVLLVLLIGGKAVNNSVSWIGYKGFGIQPSEFAKILLIPFFASYYEVKSKEKDNLLTMIIPIGIGFVIAILVILQPDFGTALIIALVVFFMFCIADVEPNLKKKIILFGVVCALSAGLILAVFGKRLFQSKLERFDYLKPCEKFQTSGNQVCNGYIAINNSNGIGKGLGNSTQKYLYLPESHTDFIYAILVEELGLIGVLILLTLYIIVLARIINIGKNSYKNSHAMICYGVAFYIFIHIVVNLGGVLGLIPLTGVTLPFISYGGSFTISLIVGLTLVQRVKYETSLKESMKS